MPVVPVAELRSLMREVLTACGAVPETAALVGDALVDANVAGHDSHGVIRALQYVEFATLGQTDSVVAPEVVRRDRATATVDARWGWGQPAMWLATRTAAELAREHGIGAVVVENCCHIGRVAPYVEFLAGEGMIGLAMSNAGRAVAPYGARQRAVSYTHLTLPTKRIV